jgi:hypothetical protein
MKPADSKLRDRLAEPITDWVESRAAAAGGVHLGIDTLTAYHEGVLAEAEQRQVQDHLVVCRECLGNLLELDEISRPTDGAIGTGTAELTDDDAWRALRRRLPVERPPATGMPHWVAALAAVLAVAVIGLALWSFAQRREASALRQRLAALSQPQPGAAVLDLYPLSEARGEDGTPAVELPAEGGYTTLILNLPAGPRHTSYEVEITDADGHRLWSGGGLVTSRFGTLRLGLPAGFLPPGEHALQLYAVDSEEKLWIETYAIRVPDP